MVEMLQLITYNWERKAILCLLIFKDCNEAVNGVTPTLILSFCPWSGVQYLLKDCGIPTIKARCLNWNYLYGVQKSSERESVFSCLR